MKAEPRGWLMGWLCDEKEEWGTTAGVLAVRPEYAIDTGRPWAGSRVWEGEIRTCFGRGTFDGGRRRVRGEGSSPGCRYKMRSQNQMRLPQGSGLRAECQRAPSGGGGRTHERDCEARVWGPRGHMGRNCFKKERVTSCIKCC